MVEISLNAGGARFYDELANRAAELNVEVTKIGNYEVVDAGVRTQGSFEAGVLVSKMCAGGLMELTISTREYGGTLLPCVEVYSEKPALSFLGGIYGDWEIDLPDFKGIGSGPARALALNRDLPKGVKKNLGSVNRGYHIYSPTQIYDLIGHKEISDVAYILLETSQLPAEKDLDWLQKQVGYKVRLRVVAARTSSRTMSVRLVSSVAETGLHKLVLLGVDPKLVKVALGNAPLPPTAFGDDDLANGMANDAIRYGGAVYYEVESGALNGIDLSELPPKNWQLNFHELMRGGFYSVDLGDFSAASFTLVSDRGLHRSGKIRADLLLKSFYRVATR
ncbi:MAG: methenyltetrahydromethanopterin cyclohydrolase [Thermoprotei archaeon]